MTSRPLENEAASGHPPGSPPALKVEGLRLADEAGHIHGPLNLAVRPGEMALVVVRELATLRRLMKCCLAFERPDFGRLSWWPDPGGRPDGGFFSRIGYVDRQSQLLHRWSLLDHFRLFEAYSGRPGDPGRELLETLGLAAQAGLKTEDLPEPLRRLALYALALHQRPRLMLLERPFQFLDLDFELVWGLIRGRAAAGEPAVVVFDRASDPYPPGSFHYTVDLPPPGSSSE